MTGFSLKDHLFNQAKVEYLSDLMAAQDRSFSKQRFVREVMSELPRLELKQRIKLIAETIERYLPRDFPNAAAQIVRSLPPPLDASKSDDDFGDYIFAPLGEFVVRNGLKKEHLRVSLHTLKEITQRFSMEDSLRAFLNQFPKETLREFTRWAKDSNYHVRRLVSESTRPLLPWSVRVNLSVESVIPLLDTLHADRTRYVTRSVANHLNDIAKSDPELVVKTLKRWHETEKQEPHELNWMTRHALRTLVKRGHKESLKLLGFDPKPRISVREIRIEKPHLKLGDTLEFSIAIQALRNESLVVDYAIDFVKANGKRSVKVFKAGKLSLSKGQTATVCKKHALRADATTFRLYEGEHFLTIQINGQPVGSKSFTISGVVSGH
jgi:3-methyladenine DNA glycosylase AlkC